MVTVVPSSAPSDHVASRSARSHVRSPTVTVVAPYCSARATAQCATAHAEVASAAVTVSTPSPTEACR